jgi:drug/metabolite transporter (DMT)-like permease
VGLQILRSALLLGATTLNFVALQYLQLAETAAIAFTIPLWVALLSVPLLGEHIGKHRWVAVLAGFVGVLIIVQPGTGLLHWAAFLSMAMAVCVALYQITTRMLAGVDSSATTLLFTAAVGTLGLLPFAIQSWSVPTAATIGPMIAIGAIGAIGHQFLITAHRWAPAPVLAPFGYVQIIPMTALGFWVFGDIPGESTLFGGLVVVGSGLYLLHRERIRQPARLQKPAEPRV